MIIETNRLILREMAPIDFDSVAIMLKDTDVMYAWEHAFSDEEIAAWIEKRIRGYCENGFDYMLAVDKISGEAVGQIGLLKTQIEGKDAIEIGYILAKKHWHKGYAAEGAAACINYAFETLRADRIVATIRPENKNSVAVVKALGLKRVGQYIKRYKGQAMPHDIYEIKNFRNIK